MSPQMHENKCVCVRSDPEGLRFVSGGQILWSDKTEREPAV